MAVDPTLNTIPQVIRAVIRDEGIGAFYKGLLPSCIGIAPYSSINFAAFDMCVSLRSCLAHAAAAGRPFLTRFALQLEESAARGGCGPELRRLCLLSCCCRARACYKLVCITRDTSEATPGVQATGGCYPLDTIRRQMQLKSSTYANVFTACTGIIARDGVGGLYRGFLPNAAKNLPNSSIRLSTFDGAKRLLKHSEAAYKAEVAVAAAEAKAAGKAKR